MSHFLYENHWGSPTLILLNVLGVLGVLNVLNLLNVLNVLDMPMDAWTPAGPYFNNHGMKYNCVVK